MEDLAWVGDRIAIADLLARYCRAIDRRDVELLRTVFWPDSSVDYGGYKGSAMGFADQVMGALDAGYETTHHTILNSSVELDGDVAHLETYVHAYHLLKSHPGQPRRVWLFAGRYVDRHEKRGGEWKIARRVIVYDFDRIDPVYESRGAEAIAPFTQGRRDRSDASYGRD